MSGIETIPENDRRERFVASGGQTEFPFDFPLYEPDHLAVYRLRGSEETQLAYGADYEVTGAGDQGGGVVALIEPAMGGDIIVLKSAQPTARTTRFVDGGDLPAAALNAEINRIFIEFQELEDQLSRAIRLAETDTNTNQRLPHAAARANGILGFDGDGNVVVIQPTLTGDITETRVIQIVEDALNRALPRKVALFYCGSVLEIPPGWQLCNGTNGTPDLRDRFIVGAGPTRPHLSTGGQDVRTTDAAGGHDHGGETQDHALTIAQMPPHNHSEGGVALSPAATGLASGSAAGTVVVDSGMRGGGDPHRHRITAAPNHSHTVTVVPAYYAAAWIMRTGVFVAPPAEGEIADVAEAALMRIIDFAASDETSAISATGVRIKLRARFAMTAREVRISLNSPCTTGTFTATFKVNGSSILSTPMTIDAGETTSVTAAVPAVLSATAIPDDALVELEVTNVGDGTATGLKGCIIGVAA